MKSTSRVAAAAATLINPRTVMPLAAIVAAGLLVTFTQVVKSAGAGLLAAPAVAASAPAVQASAPARAASASAQAASAPAPKASQPEVKDDATAEPKKFRFNAGETASGRFGSKAKQFCEHNKIANCNIVRANFDYDLPEGVEPKEVKVNSSVSKNKAMVVRLPRLIRDPSCINLGAAPFNRYGSMELRLKGIDLNPELSPAEKEEAKRLVQTGAGDKFLVTADMVFPAMPFRSRDGTVKFVKNVKVCSPEQGGRPETIEVWKLSTGKLVGDLPTCGNIGPVLMTPRREPQPVPEPQPRDDPPNEPDPEQPTPREPQPAPQPTPVAAVPKGICDHLDPSAVLGREHEPEQNGADSHSTFLAASLYCLRPFQTAGGETGVHGFGGKATASEWHGSVNNGAGHYKGWNALVGPSYKRVMERGYDWEVSVGVGKQVERYQEAAYASQREFDLVGVTAGYNDYRRRLAGETWDVERQYFGALMLPVGKKVGHTIFGQSIADTAELGRFNFGVQAGARWWFYENTEEFPLLPYLQGGIFVQHPTSASMSLRLGVADENRVVGCGVGFDQDLMHGGDPVAAAGCWLDLVKGIQVARTKVRKHQVITNAAARGITIVEKGGYIQVIRFSEPTK